MTAIEQQMELRRILMTNPHGWTLKQLVEMMLEKCMSSPAYKKNRQFPLHRVVQRIVHNLNKWTGLVVKEDTPLGIRYRWVEITGF